MLLNKSDFESGLQKDKQSFQGVNAFQIPGGPQPKSNLFGPAPNLLAGGFQMSNEVNQVQSFESQGKSKRDLLWEQKRKNKHELINPGIAKEGGASLLDQMNPLSRQGLAGLAKPQNEFQKATSFEQPQTLIEIQVPQMPLQQSIPRGQTPVMNHREIMHQQPPQQHSFQMLNDPPLMLKKENINLWDQMQQQQPQQTPPNMKMNDNQYFFQQPMPSQQIQQSKFDDFTPIRQQPLQQPPMFQQPSQMEYGFQQQLPPPQQQIIQQQSNMPASQPSFNNNGQNKQQPQQPQANQQILLKQQEEKKRQQQEYLMQIQNEIKEKEEKKKREKEDRIRKEREELKKNQEYNPFGKGGAGAPLKDNQGNVIVSRKFIDDPPQQNYNRQQPPQQNYNQQFLPQQNMMGPSDVYIHQQMQGFQPQNIQMMSPPPQFDQFNNPPPQQMLMPAPQFQMGNNFGFGGQPIQQSIEPMGFGAPPNQKMRAPEPSLMQPPQPSGFKKSDPYQDNDMSDKGGLGIGAFSDLEKEREKNKKAELQNVLKQQMEEQKRRKEEEIRKKKDEEMREEERIRKERQKMEEQYKQEEMKNKAKFNDVQQANAVLIAQKNTKPKQMVDDGPMSNYVIEKKGQKADLFGNNPVIEPVFEGIGNGGQPPLQRMSTFEGGQPNPQISQTRIISEISNELKNNFKEEITKLREEMNSQQRQFREQLDRLKGDAMKSQSEKNDAISEIERIKAELQQKYEMERQEQMRVQMALDKYNPNKPVAPMELLNNYDKPGSFPQQVKDNSYQSAGNNYPQSYPMVNNPNPMNNSFYNNSRRVGSRQESRESQRRKEINNYEKMFFNNNDGGFKKSQSQSRDDLNKKPPEYGIKEEKMVNFNQDYFKPPVQQQQQVFDYQPKIMKRADSAINNIDFGASLNAESTLLPFSQGGGDKMGGGEGRRGPPQFSVIPSVIPQQQQNSSFNPVYEDNQRNKENKQSLNYLDQLNQLGAGDVRLNTEGEDTMDFVERIVNGKKKEANIPTENLIGGKKEERFADKLDDFNFNFPSIPPYEGIQQNIFKLDNKPQEQQYKPPVQDFKMATKQPQQQQKQQFQPDVFASNFGKNVALTENTLNSLGTLNSLNLDKLNERNDNRMAKLGMAFDQFDYTQNTQVNIGDMQNFEFTPEKQQPSQQQYKPSNNGGGGGRGGNDDLQQYDSILADLLRGSEQPSNNYNMRVNSSGGRIPHINQNNNFQNQQKMRETKDQFMVPKMGQIYEEGNEDIEGTFKMAKGARVQLPTDHRRLDSLLDTTNLALE